MKKRKIKRKKKRLKTLALAVLIIVLIVLAILYFFLPLSKTDNQKPNMNKNDEKVVEKITKLDTNNLLDHEFLNWIQSSYGEKKLTKILKSFEKNTYKEQIWHDIYQNSLKVLLDKYHNNESENIKQINTKENKVTLSFIGDVSLADNWYIMPEYDKRKKEINGILSEEVVNNLKSSDITVANNEFTVSNRGEKMPGKYYTFRASPKRLSIYKEMGVDLVTLANNHVYDFGTLAFYDMLESLKEYQIPYIGAGENVDEATKPYYFIANGYKIAFLNATRAEKLILTPEATSSEGGVFRCYNPTRLIEEIKKAKSASDFVITLVHWGKEDSTELEKVQIDTAKQYIESGTDLIVGTHAHTLQGIDFYKEKAIIYNLGDFIFNNETKDTMIFQLTIDNQGEFQYKIIPCKQQDEYTYTLQDTEKARVIKKISNLSPSVQINDDGTLTKKNTGSLSSSVGGTKN